MGYEKINEPIIASDVLGYDGQPISGGGGAGPSLDLPFVSAGAGISVATSEHMVMRGQYTLAGVAMDIDSAADGNGVAILTSPAGAGKVIVGCTLTATADFGGDYPSVTPRMGVGTIQNTNSAFATGEDDILPDAAMGGSGLTGRTFTSSIGMLASPTMIAQIKPGNSIWLNVTGALTTGTGTVSVSGSLVVAYIEVNTP